MGRRNPFDDDDGESSGARAYGDFLHSGAFVDLLPNDELIGATSPLFDPGAESKLTARHKVRADVTSVRKHTKRLRAGLAADLQRFKV